MGQQTGLKKPVRQPKQARSRATVEILLEASAQILVERGWAKFTTNEVAKRAGVSIGLLYEYFGNKEALLNAILDRHIQTGEDIAIRSAQENAAGESLADTVSTLVTAYVAVHQDNPALHRVLSSEVPLSDAHHKRIRRLQDAIVALVETRLAGEVSAPKVAATMIVEAADALTHRWIVDAEGEPVQADIMARELEHMLRAYLDARRTG